MQPAIRLDISARENDHSGHVKQAALLLLGLAAAAAAAGPPSPRPQESRDSGAANWPQWRGPNRDGTTPETVATNWPDGRPREIWRADVGLGHAPVSVAAGRAVTLGHTGQNDRVWCLDAVTGSVRWQFDYAAIARCPGEPGAGAYDGPHAAPAIDGTTVYTLSRDGQVHALDLATGALRWRRDLRADLKAKLPECGFAGAPLVRDGAVVVNVGTAGVALDAGTGATRWQTGGGMAGYAAPVLDATADRQQLLLFGSRALFAVNPANGTTNWSLRWPTEYGVNAADPMVIGDGIFITSSYAMGCALLDARAGTVRWQNKNLRSQCSPPVLHKGSVYAFDGYIDWPRDEALVCLDPLGGAVRWRVPKMGGQMILAGDRVVMMLVTGDLVIAAASPDAYTELARARVCPPEKCTVPPALAAGRLYLRTGAGSVSCLAAAP